MHNAWQARANFVNQMRESFFDNHHFRFAVIENVLKVRRHEAKIERHQNRSDGGRAKEGFKHAVAVLRKDRHTVALLDAEIAHQMRPLIDAVAELPIGETMRAANDCFTIGMDSQRTFEKV